MSTIPPVKVKFSDGTEWVSSETKVNTAFIKKVVRLKKAREGELFDFLFVGYNYINPTYYVGCRFIVNTSYDLLDYQRYLMCTGNIFKLFKNAVNHLNLHKNRHFYIASFGDPYAICRIDP